MKRVSVVRLAMDNRATQTIENWDLQIESWTTEPKHAG